MEDESTRAEEQTNSWRLAAGSPYQAGVCGDALGHVLESHPSPHVAVSIAEEGALVDLDGTYGLAFVVVKYARKQHHRSGVRQDFLYRGQVSS
jgi:hypothetical protein